MEYPGSLTSVSRELDELIESENLHLVDAKVGTGSRFPLIKLLVDREDRFVTVDDCTSISRRVTELLDRTDCFPQGYRLEVSSPGISRELHEPWEFRKHLDRKLRISYRDHDQVKDIEGYLVEIEADALVVNDGTADITISFEALVQAKSIIDWHRPPAYRAR